MTDDDGLARGDALFGERHDEGGELGVGAVEAGLVEVAHVAARRASPHHKAPVCQACGQTVRPAAALVAVNVCVMSIASARRYLLAVSFSFSPACFRLAFFPPLSLGMRILGSLPRYPFGRALAAWAAFPALSRLLTGITSFPAARSPQAPAGPRSASQGRSA